MDADASFDTFEDNYGAKESSTTIKIPKKDVKKVSNTSLPSNLKTTKPSAAKGKDKKDQVDIDVEQEQEVEEDEDDASQLGGKAIGMDGQDAVSKLKAMERDIKDVSRRHTLSFSESFLTSEMAPYLLAFCCGYSSLRRFKDEPRSEIHTRSNSTIYPRRGRPRARHCLRSTRPTQRQGRPVSCIDSLDWGDVIGR